MEKEYDRFVDELPVIRDDSKAGGIRGLIQIAEKLKDDRFKKTFLLRKSVISKYFSKFIRRMVRAHTPVSEPTQYEIWMILMGIIRPGTQESLDKQ